MAPVEDVPGTVRDGGSGDLNLSVREAASLLRVSEKTIYRWIKSQAVPAFRVQDQYRLSRAELLEWATSRRMGVSDDLLGEPPVPPAETPSLLEALEAGGVHYRVAGFDRGSALREVVELLRLPAGVDRPFLLRALMAREGLGSTAVGDGVAIPHARNPVVLHIEKPTVTLCFLDQPIEFGSLDGKPVGILFTIVSPSARAHLNLMSRICFALKSESFRHALERQETRQGLLGLVRRIEEAMVVPSWSGPLGAVASGG